MRRALLPGLLACLAAPAFARQQPPPQQQVIVTGVRLQDYRDRLAACLARHCPVNEDADATLALAEALFMTGDYNHAREAVTASLGRNRHQAAAFPEPVADLFRAHSRLSRHMGFDDQAARSTDEILRALQAGIPHEDYRHFTARFEQAELQMTMTHAARARRELATLARIARASGREDVATMAELRSLWYDYIVDQNGSARRQLADMADATDPARRMRATGAKILLARIYREEGNAARSDALLAQIGHGSSGARRRLIVSPTYELVQQEHWLPDGISIDMATIFGNTLNRISENFEGKWIDVGFWILPDGHVSGLETVRRGAPDDWAAPVLEAIRHRVYSTANESSYRLERYTYTAEYSLHETGSRMRTRTPNARIEYLDLTTDEAPAAPPPAAPRPTPAR